MGGGSGGSIPKIGHACPNSNFQPPPYISEGGHLGPKWYGYRMLLEYGSHILQVLSSALIRRFHGS